MELVNEFVNNQFALYIPVALVLVGAILVFAFGFKSAEQPPFDKLSSISSEERKTTGKRRKLKEKKSPANGNVVSVSENKVDKSPSKETKRKEQTESSKKTESAVNKSVSDKKKSDSVKNKIGEDKIKKNLKVKVNEKPLDFDDGNWETVPAKGEKKKKQDSPVKKEKKNKKSDKSLEIDKLVKDVVNKELQEKDKTKDSPLSTAKEVEPQELEVTEIKVEQVELKKEKKPEKKQKKSDVEVSENIKTEEVETVNPPVKSEQPPEEMSGSVVFDELGDVWTEAKQPKKSKKKSRRDN